MNRCLRWTTGALVAGLGAGAGLAAVNRLLRLDDLPPTLPGAMHDWTWRGHRVRYTTLGSGPPVVLLHGIHAAASSFEMRHLFEPLSQSHTVYALDWLGFGKSERPDVHYSGQLYADLLADFLAEVVTEPCVLVASSLSAAYALAAVQQRPASVRHLVLLSPSFETSSSQVAGRLLRLPLIGTALFNVLVSHASIQSFMRRAYAEESRADETVIGQQWATAHQPNARLAPSAFVAGVLDLPPDRSRPVSAPTLAIRGTVPGVGRQASDDELRAVASNLTIETIPNVGQLPHDEAADRVLELIAVFSGVRASTAR